MGNLVKEFYNIQNPALSAYLLSRFSLGYMEENQDMAPMPLLFIVLPMMYKKEIVDFIASTQKKSGLRFFADKFTEKKNSNKDLILQIQNTSQRYKVMTLEAIGIGMSGKLFEIQNKVQRIRKNGKSCRKIRNMVFKIDIDRNFSNFESEVLRCIFKLKR